MYDAAHSKAQHAINALEALLDWRVALTDALAELDMAETFDDITEMVLLGELHVHPFDNSLSLCMVDEHSDGRRYYHYWLAVGQLTEIISDTSNAEITRHARLHGCTHLSLANRLGWVRAFRGKGWGTPRVFMSKEI